jgi:hypothetical protein
MTIRLVICKVNVKIMTLQGGAMHKCKCFDCGYTWFDPHQENGHALQHACPRCESDHVQYVVDSLVHDLHAGVTLTDPSILFMLSGHSNDFRFQKWMTD